MSREAPSRKRWRRSVTRSVLRASCFPRSSGSAPCSLVLGLRPARDRRESPWGTSWREAVNDGAVNVYATERTIRSEQRMTQAADSRFSRMTRGWRAAIRRSARPGPSGVTRYCSQLRSVLTLIPSASANCFCVRHMNRRKAATSPGLKFPITIRRRCACQRATHFLPCQFLAIGGGVRRPARAANASSAAKTSAARQTWLRFTS
jgi:hypothetical protein